MSPEIFEFGALRVRWYGVLFLGGFLVGLQFLERFCKMEKKPFEPMNTLLFYVLLGTTIGARVAHCIFYEPGHYLANPLEILYIWRGGLASHGGGLGFIGGLYFFSKRYPDYSFAWLLDRNSFLVALAGSFIRIGNLLNSEILGKPTGGNWGFIFERVDRIPRHPTQIYEAICYFLVFLIGYKIYMKKKAATPPGLLFGWTLVGLFVSRIFLEYFKENQSAFEASMPLNMGQLLSIPYILVGLFFVVRALRQEPKVAKAR